MGAAPVGKTADSAALTGAFGAGSATLKDVLAFGSDGCCCWATAGASFFFSISSNRRSVIDRMFSRGIPGKKSDSVCFARFVATGVVRAGVRVATAALGAAAGLAAGVVRDAAGVLAAKAAFRAPVAFAAADDFTGAAALVGRGACIG